MDFIIGGVVLVMLLVVFVRIGRIADAAEINSKYLRSIDKHLSVLETLGNPAAVAAAEAKYRAEKKPYEPGKLQSY